MASITARIVSIDNLRKELSPACHLNTSSLRAYVQKIISILQGIMTLIKSSQENLLPITQNNCLPIQQNGIAPQNRTILPTEIGVPNKTTLLILSVNKVPHQPTTTAELGAPAPNKTILLVPLVNEVSN